MTAWIVFLWAALSVLLIALSIEPRTAEGIAAGVSGAILLALLGRYLPSGRKER